MVINTLFVASLWVLIFKPFRFIDTNGVITRDIYTGLFGSAVILAPFILMVFVVLLVLWGTWLASIGKLKNRLVIIGLVTCIVSFSVTAVLFSDPPKCPWYLQTQNGACLNVNI